MNLFAGGLGASSLYSLPSTGPTLGIVGIIAYSIGVTLPLPILAVFGKVVRNRWKERNGKDNNNDDGFMTFIKERWGRGVHFLVRSPMEEIIK